MPTALTPLLAKRFSARSYEPREISDEDLRSIFEAARWAPSSRNEQPWSFIVARRQDRAAFEALLHCLAEQNQAWAKDAGALLACVTAKNFAHKDLPNRHAWHDMGLAVMAMEVQAVSLGLQARQMGGIDGDKVRQAYGVPETHEVVSGLAIGAPGDVTEQLSKRSRKPLESFVFEGAWGKSIK